LSETGDSLRNSLFLHFLVAEIVETYEVTRSWGRGLRAEKTRPASSACSITSSKSRTSIWDSKGFDSRFPLLSSFCCIAADVRCFMSSCPGPSVIFAFRPIAFALTIRFNSLMISSTTHEIRTKSEPQMLTTELLQTDLHCSKALLKETTQFETQEDSYKTLTVRIFVERRGTSDRGQILHSRRTGKKGQANGTSKRWSVQNLRDDKERWWTVWSIKTISLCQKLCREEHAGEGMTD